MSLAVKEGGGSMCNTRCKSLIGVIVAVVTLTLVASLLVCRHVRRRKQGQVEEVEKQVGCVPLSPLPADQQQVYQAETGRWFIPPHSTIINQGIQSLLMCTIIIIFYLILA